jgi:hypothetical protein
MRNEETYTETYTWADLVGANCADDGDWDDCYGRDGHDWRRAQRDGWGNQMVWDGR